MIQATLNTLCTPLSAILRGQDTHFFGVSTDTRQSMANQLFVALAGEHFDAHDFIAQAEQQGAVALLVSRPVNSTLPQLIVTNTLTALGQLGHWWLQQCQLPGIAAITGSNGKTTVKEMLSIILAQHRAVLHTQGNLNNEIGLPLTLCRLAPTHEIAVLEMGASRAGDIALLTKIAPPSVATITLCAPSHLQGFGSIEGVARAKGEIFSALQPGGTAIINQDDAYADDWHMLIADGVQRLTFGLSADADVTAHTVQLAALHSDFHLHTPQGDIDIHLPLSGQHNVMNALNAAACALACGCTLAQIKTGLAQMQTVKGRLQPQAGLRHTQLLNDTYNANPISLKAGLEVLSRFPAPRWLILGDMKELGEEAVSFHRMAGHLARDNGVTRLWATGELSRHAVEAFGKGGQHFEQCAALIETLQAEVTEGATLLVKGSRSMGMEAVVSALKPT